jgi:catalase
MNTPPVMAVATPEAFFQQLQALSPDPITKQRDPEKITAFFKAHPESKAFNDWKADYVPANSFAAERYHSINAFYLHNELGDKQAVRWVARPHKATNNAAMLDTSSANALQQELASRLDQNAVKFDLIFTLAASNDDENNPTIPWPSDRQTINAGTLSIVSWHNQENAACGDANFDPLVLPQGMSATADPILRARGAVYAQSYRRRAKETLLGAKVSATNGGE